jgi:signal transduction histidine kinase
MGVNVSEEQLATNPILTEATVEPPVGGVLWEMMPRLIESLLHDARNPLNALAINLEVLTDKLRQSEAPSTGEKNIRAMREQIRRVDTILRRFGDFLAPRPLGSGEVNLSEIAEAAIEVAGHEMRKKHLRVVARLEPALKVWLPHAGSAYLLTLQSILRAIGRAEDGSDIEVSLFRQAGGAVFAVTDSSSGSEKESGLGPALEQLCRDVGGTSRVRGGELRFSFPSKDSDVTGRLI